MKVLIAIDESAFVEPIVDFVVSHQWSDDTIFKIVHVVEPVMVGSYLSALPPPAIDELRSKMMADSKLLLSRAKQKLQEKIQPERVFEELIDGFPKEAILFVAKDWRADLVIVGSHGRTGLDHFLMGSVSAAVVEGAKCSVLVVRRPCLNAQSQAKASSRVAIRG